MKPVVLSAAAAVLLLISLANHRQQTSVEKSGAEIRSIPQCGIMTDNRNTPSSDTQTLSGPVNMSGKINFFVVTY